MELKQQEMKKAKAAQDAEPAKDGVFSSDDVRTRSAERLNGAVSPGRNSDAGSFLDPSTNKFSLDSLKDKTVAGVDPKRREYYLEDDEFQRVMSVPKAEYEAMVGWKKMELKKKAGMF